MHSKIVHPLILVLFISTFISDSFQQKSVPKSRLSPINIDTSKIIFVSTTTPFTVHNEVDGLEIVHNGGNAIYSHSLPFARTHISGGLLKNSVYRIGPHFLFINQNDSQGRSGYTIDDKTYPIEGVVTFYNVKYGTYQNAMNYNDGLIVFTEPTKVGRKHNPEFEPFEKILLSGALKQPNSSIITSAKNFFIWYDTLVISHSYYAFAGSFYDPLVKKQVSSATCVVTRGPYNYISHEQFKAFRNVLGFDGKPIETIAPIYRAGRRTIQGAIGEKIAPIPFSSFIFLLQVGTIILSRIFT